MKYEISLPETLEDHVELSQVQFISMAECMTVYLKLLRKPL